MDDEHAKNDGSCPNCGRNLPAHEKAFWLTCPCDMAYYLESARRRGVPDLAAETDAVLIGYPFVGLNAKQDIVAFCILLTEIMHIVGSYQGDVEPAGQRDQEGIDLLLKLQTMILKLDIEVPVSKV